MGYIQSMDSCEKLPTDPAASFQEAVSIMQRLRGAQGCPWDREQTLDSIKPYTLEETYEVFDAIERRNWEDLREELGDLLLQVLFYAQMAAEEGRFTIADVIAGLNRKLIRRHPHVFGEQAAAAAGNSAKLTVTASDSAQVLRNWETIKQAEKTDRSGYESALDSAPRSLPALSEARKLGSRAQKSGFDWPDLEGLFDKLGEETSELRQAIKDKENQVGLPEASAQAIAGEIGDLLFTTVNLARRLKVDPEFALRHTNAKFRRRFAFMERNAPGPLETMSAAELDSLWTQAKDAEASTPAL